MGHRLQKKTNSDFEVVLNAIRRIVRSLRHSSKSTEKNLGLSASQIFVLQKLAQSKKTLSINELAAATFTHQSTVSVVVSKLVDRNLVDRIVNSTDSRSVDLSINKQGEYLLGKSPTSFQDRLMNAFLDMSKHERKSLVVGLQALILKARLQNEEPTMLMEEEETR